MANPEYKEGRGDYYRAEGLRDASVTLTGTLTDSGAEWARAIEVEAAGRRLIAAANALYPYLTREQWRELGEAADALEALLER